MEFVEEKKSGTLDAIIILAGLAFLYLIFKSNQQKEQSILSQQSQQQIYPQYQDVPVSRYENEESWQIVRGENGFIEDLKVGRNATVGNSMTSQSPVRHERPTTPVTTTSDLDNYIDNRLRDMMKKSLEEMNKYNNHNNRFVKLNDNERKTRFGFA